MKKTSMGRWFRFYDEVVDDRKIHELSDRQFRFWVNCMCLASRCGGALPPLMDIAFHLRKSESQVATLLQQIGNTGRCLIDTLPDGTLRPHNWDIRQFKSDVSTDRVRAFRERSPTVSGNVSETFQKRFHPVSETPSDTDTESETEKVKGEKDLDWGGDGKMAGSITFPANRFLARINPTKIPTGID